MKLLFLTNDAKKLRQKYRFPITALVVGCIFGTFPISCLFGTWLANLLHLSMAGQAHSDDADIRFLWLVLFLAFFITDMIIGYLMSFVLLAAILRWFYHWPVSALRLLFLESKHPRRWLKDEFAEEATEEAERTPPKPETDRADSILR